MMINQAFKAARKGRGNLKGSPSPNSKSSICENVSMSRSPVVWKAFCRIDRFNVSKYSPSISEKNVTFTDVFIGVYPRSPAPQSHIDQQALCFISLRRAAPPCAGLRPAAPSCVALVYVLLR